MAWHGRQTRTAIVAFGFALAAAAAVRGQERPVPSDSEQVSLAGCAKGRNFVVAEGPEHEPKQVVIAPGRRFRLAGSKEALDGIKRREGHPDSGDRARNERPRSPPGGVSIAGGRIRLGGAVPRQPMNDPARDPAYNQAVIDVQAGVCSTGDRVSNFVAPGAVWLKRWLAIDQQRMLVDQCRAFMDGPAGGYVPTVRGGGKMRVRMTCLGRHWNAKTYTYEDVRGHHDGQPVLPLPQEWVALASRLAADAGFVARPDICLIMWKRPEGRMGLHQDKDEGADSIKGRRPRGVDIARRHGPVSAWGVAPSRSRREDVSPRVRRRVRVRRAVAASLSRSESYSSRDQAPLALVSRRPF